jgi:hypothetical protein
MDSKAIKDLPLDVQERIIDKVNAEKDPKGNMGLNTNFNVDAKGEPCK